MAQIHRFKFINNALLKNISNCRFAAKRYILSEAYLCEEAWKKRLENPLLKNIDTAHFFIEIDKKFGTKRSVSGVDIAMFAYCVQEYELDELEHLLYRFRKTKRCVELHDSTIYAVIKVFLKFKQYDSLLHILNNRESYGIFPDLYLYNMLMSTFLKENLHKEAAQTAILMMLQEDFSNEISCALGLYSCQTLLNEGLLDSLKSGKEEENKEVEDDEDENITYVRVPFLRNHWYDDHFNITKPKHLVGKTLYRIGREMNNILGRSYELVGLAMYEKWEKAATVLKSFIEQEDLKILSEAVEKFKLEIANIPDDKNNTREKTLSTFEGLLQEIEASNKVVEGALMKELKVCLKESLKFEERDIKAQHKLFPDWELQMRTAYDRQLQELDKEKRLKIIEEKKEYLYWKEKLLFFFENENKLLLDFNDAEEYIEKVKACAATDETYVPPEALSKPLEEVSKYKKLARVKIIR